MINIEEFDHVRSLYPCFVFHPLRENGKIPITQKWEQLQTTPKNIIENLKHGCNVGVVCGKASDMMVFDFDHFLFVDEMFNGCGVTHTLVGKRTEGRGHMYFKYTNKIKASKHHDLGIEILSDGSNVVISPSIHKSGEKYILNKMPIAELPEKAISNLNEMFTTETELKQLIGKCRTCFKKILTDKPNLHGAEGREYMLAVCTDLKARGAIDKHILMFAKLIYGKDFDSARTLKEYGNIDASKTWTCDKLKQKVSSFLNQEVCDRCKIRREDYKVKAIEELKQPITDEPEAPQHIIDKALEVLKAGKAIEYLIDAYHTMHVGDTVTGKMILASIASQSVLNSSGLQPKLSAGSGKGKSHAAKTILHLVHPKYVLETSLSGKALYYKEGLQPGTLIYSDDTEPDEELQATIKKSTTNFQSKTNREIPIKSDGEWITKTFTIPERIVWLLTSVNDTGSIEYLNRQFNLSVDESTSQDELVYKRMQEQAIKGTLEYPITDNILVCREIINEIKKHLFIVTIPFADRIEWSDKENRRNGAQFFDIIKSFAVFDFMNRPQVKEGTIEATIEDFNNALTLYATRAINQKLKLNDNEQNKLSLMKIGIKYTMPELQEMFGLSQGAIHTLLHGRKDRNGGGLLSKVSALTTEKETEYLGDMEDETKKSKSKTLYCLTKDFKNMASFESVAFLRKV